MRNYLIALALVLAAFFGIGAARSATRARAIYEQIQQETVSHNEWRERIEDKEAQIQEDNLALAAMVASYSEANAKMDAYHDLALNLVQVQNFNVEAAVSDYLESADEEVAALKTDLGVTFERLEILQEELDQLQKQQQLAKEAAQAAVLNELTVAVVTRIVDGDTIEANIDGNIRSVRLIGVDAPERRRPGHQEATNFVAYHVPVGSTVWLQQDGRNTDRFNRLRRYIWTALPTGLRDEGQIREHMLNAMLLESGHAEVLVVRGDQPVHEALFRRLER